MSQRLEFVMLASRDGANVRELCRRFQIGSATAYKWLKRFAEQGRAGLVDRSRIPRCSPLRTPTAVQRAILELRDAHPAWGARTLQARLRARGHSDLPAPSTIQAILQRQGRIDPARSQRHRPWQRFEHPAPNDLWQMDFKGHFPVGAARCHPLTVLDDHSRFAVCLQGCRDERAATVTAALIPRFRRYGLPRRMLMDNGAPWAGGAEQPYTEFSVWLIRLGIAVSHGQAYHPQTQGKDERFHRTLIAEVLMNRTFTDWAELQQRFDEWRELYNQERPHQALACAVPASRYQPSPRPFPETLPAIEYGPEDIVRRVQGKGELHFKNRLFTLSRAFRGQPVALRPTLDEALWKVFFCHQQIAQIDLRDSQ